MTIGVWNGKGIAWLKQILWTEMGWAWILVLLTWATLLLTGHHDHQLVHAHKLHSDGAAFFQWLLYAFGSWHTMLVAMMLPSALPMAKLLNQVNEQQSDRAQVQLAFVLGYLAIWSGFSSMMVLGSAFAPQISHTLGLAHVPDRWILGLTSIGVGVFQFTPLKKSCLKGCRSISTFLAQHYQRGWKGGLDLGLQHGLYCLGCCWALMIEMAMVGMENLGYMLVLTAIMTLERLWKYGELFANWVGVAFIGLGGVLIYAETCGGLNSLL